MTPTDKQFYQTLGQRIACYRKAHGLTQRQLAEILGISQQTLAHYEVGRLRVAVVMLPQLAQAMKISVETLLQTETSTAKTQRGPAFKLQQQIEQIQQLPRTKQKFVSKMLETVLQQAS